MILLTTYTCNETGQILTTKRQGRKKKIGKKNKRNHSLLMEISAEYVDNDEASSSVSLLLAGCGMSLLLSFTAG